MKSNKKNLVFILTINLIIVGFAIYVLTNRYRRYKTQQEEPPAQQVQPQAKLSNILFQYLSSKAKSVQIVGDFNDWSPQKLNKTKNNLWKIVLKLNPGVYTYNFIVDGQLILDPNNLKPPVTNINRKIKSSFLEIKPSEKK